MVVEYVYCGLYSRLNQCNSVFLRSRIVLNCRAGLVDDYRTFICAGGRCSISYDELRLPAKDLQERKIELN